MLGQKLIKIRALREGLRFFAIYSSKMIFRDLHGTFYINTHSNSKRSTTAQKNFYHHNPRRKAKMLALPLAAPCSRMGEMLLALPLAAPCSRMREMLSPSGSDIKWGIKQKSKRSESSLSISQKKERRQAIRNHYQRRNQATTAVAPGTGAEKRGVSDSGAWLCPKKKTINN